MSNIKKLMMSAAGGDALDVDDVFSTYVYAANNAAQTITNGIDLAGEGGMVWGKSRSAITDPRIYDTEGNGLYTSLVFGAYSQENRITSFNNNGFSLGTSSGLVGGSGFGGPDYVSWTFRKAPKFFDVVTWTGNGSTNRDIAHSLGSEPGMIFIKRTDASESWIVYHRSAQGTGTYWSKLELESTGGEFGGTRFWGSGTGEDHTSSTFHVSGHDAVNGSGMSYVAYLFAHNNGDGEFGPDGDQDIIKCGSYTGNAHTGQYINVGFEPQWLIIKRTNQGSANWVILDTMRGLPHGDNPQALYANLANAETKQSNIVVSPTATGFWLDDDAPETNEGSDTYIYVAIRRGSLFPPESGTEVFATDHRGSSAATAAGTSYYSGFPVDWTFGRNRTYAGGDTSVYDRLRGDKNLFTNLTNAEGTVANYLDSNQGFWGSTQSENTAQSAWMWKRAPGYFDVVAYTGTGAAQAVSHNLGVVPELMISRRRDAVAGWAVYSSALGATKFLRLHSNDAPTTLSSIWNDTAPSATQFTVGSTQSATGGAYIQYLFATLAGISKVGSYTGNGTNQNIDCGFTSGARFVLIKPTDAGNSWYMWDSTRGIVAGNDPFLLLNTTNAEITNSDYIDPYSGGFNVTGGAGTVNQSGKEHIFYAVA